MARRKSKITLVVAEDRQSGAQKTENPPKPKDKDEEELEKLVFPDLAGWELNDNFDDEDSGEESGTGLVIRDDGDEDDSKIAALNDDELFFIDTALNEVSDLVQAGSDDGSDLEHNHNKPTHLTTKEPKAAWADSDDERIVVSLTSQKRLRKFRLTEEDDLVNGKEYARRLRYQFEHLYPVPQWALPLKEKKKRRKRRASFDGSSSDTSSIAADSDIEMGDAHTHRAEPLSTLLQSTTGYISTRPTTHLSPTKLNISRLQDANHLAPSKSNISSLSFHPTHPLLMSGGPDHTLRMYHIDGKVNPPVTSLHIRKSAIQTALFHPDGKRVFAGGRRKFFYTWDLETGAIERITRIYGHEVEQRSMENFKLSPDGKYMSLIGNSGTVNILDANSLQWVTSARIDSSGVSEIAWYGDSSGLTIAGKGAEIWEYNLGQRRFTSRWFDEGGVSTKRVALGGAGDRWCAVGGSSGIVNIYDRKQSTFESGNAYPKPMKVLEQLVTPITDLSFSADGQILCMNSWNKSGALRMVHFPTCSVYQNWPTSVTPLGKVDAIAFAPQTLMFAAGNEHGKIRLWEISP